MLVREASSLGELSCLRLMWVITCARSDYVGSAVGWGDYYELIVVLAFQIADVESIVLNILFNYPESAFIFCTFKAVSP